MKNLKFQGYLVPLLEACIREIKKTGILKIKTLQKFDYELQNDFYQAKNYRRYVIQLLVRHKIIKIVETRGHKKRFKFLQEISESSLPNYLNLLIPSIIRDIKIINLIKEYENKNETWTITKLRIKLQTKRSRCDYTIRKLIKKKILIRDYNKPRIIILNKITLPYTLVLSPQLEELFKYHYQ